MLHSSVRVLWLDGSLLHRRRLQAEVMLDLINHLVFRYLNWRFSTTVLNCGDDVSILLSCQDLDYFTFTFLARNVQSCIAAPGHLHLQIYSQLYKLSHDVDMASRNGHHQGRHALVPRAIVDVGSILDQEIHNVFILYFNVDGVVQRRRVILIDGRHVRI